MRFSKRISSLLHYRRAVCSVYSTMEHLCEVVDVLPPPWPRLHATAAQHVPVERPTTAVLSILSLQNYFNSLRSSITCIYVDCCMYMFFFFLEPGPFGLPTGKHAYYCCCMTKTWTWCILLARLANSTRNNNRSHSFGALLLLLLQVVTHQ